MWIMDGIDQNDNRWLWPYTHFLMWAIEYVQILPCPVVVLLRILSGFM